jgi:hypothetical protein
LGLPGFFSFVSFVLSGPSPRSLENRAEPLLLPKTSAFGPSPAVHGSIFTFRLIKGLDLSRVADIFEFY